MAVATRRSDPQGSEPTLVRFDRGERVLHWVNATLFAVMLGTALCLYVPALSAQVGRREVVKTIHVYTGLALPFPLLLTALAPRWGRAFRSDARRLNRWSGDDRQWLRSFGRDPGVRLGKFNPGQKLNASFTLGAIVVMIGTGFMMRWPQRWPLAWRTGATFVHDWIFLALVVTITGHMMLATRDRDALGSMVSGRISRRWARFHAPRWLEREEHTKG